MKYIFLCIVFGLSFILLGCNKKNPIEKATRIAERIMHETVAETEKVEIIPLSNIQVIDFNNIFGKKLKSFCYAKNIITAPKDTSIKLGISSSIPIVIKINSSIVFKQETKRDFKFREEAYNLFTFQDTFSVNLKKGENDIILKAFVTEGGFTFIRQITPYETTTTILFGDAKNSNDWLFLKSEGKNFESLKIEDEEIVGRWIQHPKIFQDKLVINPSNTYKRESYYEWHYAIGTTMLGLINLNSYIKNPTLYNYIKGYCDFALRQKSIFKTQYESLHALRTGNYRMFRKSMLDDTGPAALPFVEVYQNEKDEQYLEIIKEMTDYVVLEQARLSDGTFCRPEPAEMTIWADDLFMSTQLMLRAANILEVGSYYDDIANQIKNFHKYLWDEQLNLHRHAWFDFEKKQSAIAWSRANGWIIWSISSTLLYLPKTHKDYGAILDIYKIIIDGLVDYQGKNGLWHQVLDRTDSFKETSGSAMYTLAIARGVTNGWLSHDYKKYALKGWDGISKNISDDGIVKDICRGTGIGYDFDFYNNRKRFDNDPRGLGAVITAATEIAKIMQ